MPSPASVMMCDERVRVVGSVSSSSSLYSLPYGVFEILFARAHPDRSRPAPSAKRRRRRRRTRRSDLLQACLDAGNVTARSTSNPGLECLVDFAVAPSGSRACRRACFARSATRLRRSRPSWSSRTAPRSKLMPRTRCRLRARWSRSLLHRSVVDQRASASLFLNASASASVFGKAAAL